MDSELPHSVPNALWNTAVVLLGSVVLYLLSIGPAVYLAGQSPRVREAVLVIYAPLALIEGTPLEPSLRAYAGWWRNLPPGPAY